jgi:hypothetical protein
MKEIAAGSGQAGAPGNSSMTSKSRSINWLNISTVISAAILIGAEVFGAAFAASWAISTLFGFDPMVRYGLDAALSALGLVLMFNFMRSAMRVEPFVTNN